MGSQEIEQLPCNILDHKDYFQVFVSFQDIILRRYPNLIQNIHYITSSLHYINSIQTPKLMLSYLSKTVSKTVSKAYKASKKALAQKPAYKETEQYKLIRKLQKYDSEILPTNMVSELASLSYSLQKFQLIFDIMMIRIDSNNFDHDSTKQLKQFRNSLIICTYLIKHGASGFIDQFRQNITVFEGLSGQFNLRQISPPAMSSKMRYYVADIINRLRYITDLLQDKNKLIRQKEISMLIKQKLKMAEKEKENISGNGQHDLSEPQNKIDNFLDNYLWKYAGIIDGKLDQIADVIAEKFQKYLLEEIPENFQIDQIQIKEQNRIRSQANFAENQIQKEKTYLENKQKLQKKQENEDLL